MGVYGQVPRSGTRLPWEIALSEKTGMGWQMPGESSRSMGDLGVGPRGLVAHRTR